MSISWIFFISYAVVYLLTWRTVVWKLATENGGRYRPPDGGDICFAVFMGSFANLLVCPFVFPARWVMASYERRGQDFHMFVMPRKVRQQEIIKRQKEELERYEREVRRLERETLEEEPAQLTHTFSQSLRGIYD